MKSLLKLAQERGYTKKWLSTEYNLLSYKGYYINGEFDTKKEAIENLGGGMLYSKYEAIRNPNYNKIN